MHMMLQNRLGCSLSIHWFEININRCMSTVARIQQRSVNKAILSNIKLIISIAAIHWQKHHCSSTSMSFSPFEHVFFLCCFHFSICAIAIASGVLAKEQHVFSQEIQNWSEKKKHSKTSCRRIRNVLNRISHPNKPVLYYSCNINLVIFRHTIDFMHWWWNIEYLKSQVNRIIVK